MRKTNQRIQQGFRLKNGSEISHEIVSKTRNENGTESRYEISHKMKQSGLMFSLLFILLMGLTLTGCGSSGRLVTYGNSHYYTGRTQTETEETEEVEEETELFLITAIDNTQETLILYRFQNDLEYQYHYGLDTRFLDKYGNHASATDFSPGKVVEIGNVNSFGRLSQIQISDSVWEYEKVSRFSVDTESGIFQIADSKYSYGDNLYLFSNGDKILLNQITAEDTLSIVGMDRRILSISVTTGHGILKLSNTELFEGSYLQLDNKVFAEVMPGMTIELSEGTYTLAVANDGWGGSQEITITRGTTTEVDLDAIKGEGPKSGNILFAIDVTGATLKIDGATVDYTNPVTLGYGRHSIQVKADGYEDWSRILYVNSQEATIIIELEGETEDTEDDTESTENSSEEDDSEDSGEDEEDGDSVTEEEVLEDYLSTLSQLLGSLT